MYIRFNFLRSRVKPTGLITLRANSKRVFHSRFCRIFWVGDQPNIAWPLQQARTPYSLIILYSCAVGLLAII